MRIVFFILFTLSAFADPMDLEVVFLAHKPINASLLENILAPYRSGEKLAQAGMENCVPMGDGCFHPQYGIIPKGEFKQKQLEEYNSVGDEDEEEGETEVNTINASETDMIDCDKNSYFDIFCGKAKSRGNPKIEVWVDNSTSMRNADYSKDLVWCERRHFVSKIRKICGSKIVFSTFDSTVTELGSDQNLCTNAGMNNGERIVDAIKGSNAKYLLIITDVDEYKEEFRDYLDLVKAKLTGIGASTVTSEQLSGIYSNRFEKLCK